MRKHIFSLNMIALLAAVALLGVLSGGCGGGSSHKGSVVNRAETVFDASDLALLTMDIDGNGMPDFLDFEGVSQIHVDNSASNPSGEIFEAASLAVASEKTVTVPSMIWLDQLRLASEDANLFSVRLEAGKEYTFEFSKNLTEALGDILPSVKVYDPANARLYVENAEAMDFEKIAAYPEARPSVICYTVKPTVTGTYLVQVSNGEPTTNEDANKTDTKSVLFIYEEFRNEDGETGYYTNFKFQDEDGNKTRSVSAGELILLRQLFLEANPAYFEEVYGWDLLDDASGMGGTDDAFEIQNDNGDYARALYWLLSDLGVQSTEDALSEEEMKELERQAQQNNSGVPYKLEPIPELGFKGKVTVAGNGASGNKVAISALDDQPAQIDTDITGIPYDARYEIGGGFLAISHFNPMGGIKVDISKAYNEARKAYLALPAAERLSTHTESYAEFVSTSQQAESLLKTSSNLGLSSAAVGGSYGSGTTNNLKFGLTSTNLVIHYEVTENGYRTLDYGQLVKAWNDIGFIAAVQDPTGILFPTGPDFLPRFRNTFGDYYVAGYQYGACYDAYISITTDTSEQTREVERKLSAQLNLGSGDDKLSASADIGSKLTETLKEANAKIAIRIVTNGVGHNDSVPTKLTSDPTSAKAAADGDGNNDSGEKVPQPKEVLNISNVSGDVDINDAMTQVSSELVKFIEDVRAKQDPANFAPVRVKLSRWRSNFTLGLLMMQKGDMDGTIPVTVGQTKTIRAFNSRLKDLTGYRNVVDSTPVVDKEAKADIEAKYQDLLAAVTAGGERFYADKAEVEKYLKVIDEISPKFKALSDRYVFYTKLVLAQKAEEKTYNDLLKGAQASSKGSDQSRKFVKQMPFGGSNGGSSGYDQFGLSQYVTEDIDAGGKEQHKQYYKENNSNFFRRFWYENQKEGDDEYLASAGPAVLTATAGGDNAVFCKVRVTSDSRNRDTDNLRELTHGAPAVGTTTVGFNFESGRGDHVDWNIYGKAMRMRRADYPFDGLK